MKNLILIAKENNWEVKYEERDTTFSLYGVSIRVKNDLSRYIVKVGGELLSYGDAGIIYKEICHFLRKPPEE